MEEELSRLRSEVVMLRRLLVEHGIPVPVNQNDAYSRKRTTEVMPPEAKIKLFRKLFRGRDDVYPVRWESRQSGKAGYSPVCANEWRSGICQKPRIKCGECSHSMYVPMSDDVIYRHLTGDITAGVYPLVEGDRSYF